ncbi:MAG: gamma-glutamylcyclotransferase [Hyphomonadaceae bacterium]|nr:gamma-glutamylcyclotransferase [Hyphomonadaceae bacterium]
MIQAIHRLAIYGTLAPGRVNHDQVSMIDGTWRDGVVRGWLSEDGWGATLGFPGLKLDPDGEVIKVQVLESPDLPAHWARLDEFEGAEYARVVASVETETGPVEAYVYVVSE